VIEEMTGKTGEWGAPRQEGHTRGTRPVEKEKKIGFEILGRGNVI